MGTFGGAQPIVTDGLVFAVDAANYESYPGSGTTWSGLSGNGNGGTIYNSPIFNNNNGGYFAFDGTDEYVKLTNEWTWSMGYTINVWLNLTNSSGGAKYFLGRDNTSTMGVRYNCNTETFLVFSGGSGYTFASYDQPTTWVMYTAYRTGTSTYKSYVNGESIGTNDSGIDTDIKLNLIGKRRDGYNTDADIACVSFYEKTLSDTEISQNYNALKSRFGL